MIRIVCPENHDVDLPDDTDIAVIIIPKEFGGNTIFDFFCKKCGASYEARTNYLNWTKKPMPGEK